jgi:hypothetical protein
MKLNLIKVVLLITMFIFCNSIYALNFKCKTIIKNSVSYLYCPSTKKIYRSITDPNVSSKSSNIESAPTSVLNPCNEKAICEAVSSSYQHCQEILSSALRKIRNKKEDSHALILDTNGKIITNSNIFSDMKTLDNDEEIHYSLKIGRKNSTLILRQNKQGKLVSIGNSSDYPKEIESGVTISFDSSGKCYAAQEYVLLDGNKFDNITKISDFSDCLRKCSRECQNYPSSSFSDCSLRENLLQKNEGASSLHFDQQSKAISK